MGWPSAFEIWWDLLEVEISMKTFLYMHIQSVCLKFFGFWMAMAPKLQISDSMIKPKKSVGEM